MSTPVSTPDNHENSSAFPEAIDELLHELLSRRALSVLASTPWRRASTSPMASGAMGWRRTSRACRATYKIIVIRETGLAAGKRPRAGAWLRGYFAAGFCSSTGSSSASTSFFSSWRSFLPYFASE